VQEVGWFRQRVQEVGWFRNRVQEVWWFRYLVLEVGWFEVGWFRVQSAGSGGYPGRAHSAPRGTRRCGTALNRVTLTRCRAQNA